MIIQINVLKYVNETNKLLVLDNAIILLIKIINDHKLPIFIQPSEWEQKKKA